VKSVASRSPAIAASILRILLIPVMKPVKPSNPWKADNLDNLARIVQLSGGTSGGSAVAAWQVKATSELRKWFSLELPLETYNREQNVRDI
jgi:hypothetical protein